MYAFFGHSKWVSKKNENIVDGSTTPAPHVWSSGFLRCRSDGMKFTSTLTPGPCSEHRRLQIGIENSSICDTKGQLAHYRHCMHCVMHYTNRLLLLRLLEDIGGKERLKRWVLGRFLKEQSVTSPSWRFAAEYSTLGMQHSEKLGHWWLKRQTTSDDDEAEWRRWQASASEDWWISSVRCEGAVWCRHL